MKTIPDETAQVEAPDVRGYYMRRLAAVNAIAGGIQALVSLVAFKDLGDERHSVIISDEPLFEQTVETHVPNVPAEVVHADDTEASSKDGQPSTHPITLKVQALSPRVIHLQLGSPGSLAGSRDFGMLVSPALADKMGVLSDASSVQLSETEKEVTATLASFTIRLRRDPFAISITCEDVPTATIETALDDRNVHGLLCTPPPGMLISARDEPDAFWSWALSPDEHLYGLGERFARLDHRGEHVTLWTTDAWGTTTESSYKNVPFLYSSRGYGLFFHTSTPVKMQLGNPSARAALVSAGEASIDLFIVFGNTPKEVLDGYTRLTGRATMPPRWAFGVWLSRCRYQTRKEVEAVAARARAEDVPCDVLHIDPAWLERPGLSCDFVVNEEAFPDLPGMVRELGENGFKVSLWELPYISVDARRFNEAEQAGFFLRNEQGEPICADFGGPPPDGRIRAVLDFTNPSARAWWQELHRPLLRAGVAVFKTDFGEGVPLDAHAYNGMTGRELHNLFPLLYNAAVHEVITQETGRPGMVWGRSSWAGSQRYPAQWGGDPKTDAWSMASSLRGGLSMALSAPGIWAHDIGGFYGPSPSSALYIRWAEFGLLSPLARAHGTTPREPWEFGDEALSIFRRYARLRTRLNPYLYTMAFETHERGLPMLRPLLLEFPDDPVTAHIDDAYLLGSALLVAPIFSESSEPVTRQLYLPPGEWVDFWTDERISGGRYIKRVAALDTIPVYVRAGTILPLGPERAFIGDEVPESLTLEVYTGTEGSAQVVWDARGTATELHLHRTPGEGSDEQTGWQLDIRGDYIATWHVRWHTAKSITEADAGRVATASVVL